MLADGEKILFLRAVPHTFTITNTSSMISIDSAVFYAVVVAGHALASVNPSGGGVVPADVGEVNLRDEGTKWVRGWDEAARDALLAANKFTDSVDAAE